MLNPFKTISPADPDNEINSVLVHTFSLGSELAFRRIYDLYAPPIYRVSARYLNSEQLASELVQEVFSNFWLERAKFAKAEEVNRYLFTTAWDVTARLLKEMAKRELEGSEVRGKD